MVAFFSASSLLAIWGLIQAVRRRLPGAWLLMLLVASYPLAYYVVYVHARYRHTIEPELAITFVFLVSEGADRSRRVKAGLAGQ